MFENKVYEGVAALLGSLQAAGARLVLATSKPEIFARRILEHFDLANYFYLIGGADMSGARVTKEAVLGYALAELGGVSPEDSVMVGDRKYDVAGRRGFSYRYRRRDIRLWQPG